MKHVRHMTMALTLMAVIIGAGSVSAQHYIGISVAGHVPMAIDRLSTTHTQAAYGGSVGFVYEWHAKHFILQTGLHYAMDCPRMRIDSQLIEQDMVDTRGVPFTYRGILEQRIDQIFAGQVSIPFYLGGEWKGLYVMAGARAVLNLHANSKQIAQLKSVGDYGDRYYDLWENMPNHGYIDFQSAQTVKPGKLSLFDVHLGTEVGYTIHTSSPLIRIGIFAEYGLFNMYNNMNSAVPCTQADYSKYMSVEMTNIYFSSEGETAKPHFLISGLKVTILYPTSKLKKKHNDVHCIYYVDPSL